MAGLGSRRACSYIIPKYIDTSKCEGRHANTFARITRPLHFGRESNRSPPRPSSPGPLLQHLQPPPPAQWHPPSPPLEAARMHAPAMASEHLKPTGRSTAHPLAALRVKDRFGSSFSRPPRVAPSRNSNKRSAGRKRKQLRRRSELRQKIFSKMPGRYRYLRSPRHHGPRLGPRGGPTDVVLASDRAGDLRLPLPKCFIENKRTPA